MERSNYWTRMSRRRVLKGAGAGAVASGLLLAGVSCGDDDDDSGDSGGGGGSTSTTQSGGSPAAGTPKLGGRLKELNTSEPDQYDPHRDAGYPGLLVMSAVYNALLRTRLPIGQDFKVEGDLTEGLPEQPDNKTYIFKLADGIKWQNVSPTNGREMTSDDIKKNFERMTTNQPDFVLRPMFELIDKIETPDKKTIKVTLKEPYGQFIVNNADIWAKVIPPELYDGDKAKLKPV